jgi:entericidin B
MARAINISTSKGPIMLKKIIYCFAALAAALSLSACNTVGGVGKDVERGGQKIQDEAKEHKTY